MKGDCTRYNVLWVTLDSVKATALPVYGNPHVIAPNAERAARNGITFTNAFCQMPKCVPVRPSQIMGRYPHADGLRALSGKIGSESSKGNFVVTRGMPNIVELLHDNGYVTCAKGPNHLVAWDVYEEWFDETTDWEPYKRAHNPAATESDPELLRAQYGGELPEGYDIEKSTDTESVRQMCDFLARHDKSKPFFAYLDIRAPHPLYRRWFPWAREYDSMDIPVPTKAELNDSPWVEQVYRKTYDLERMSDDKWRRIIGAYYSAITFNDMLVGRVLDELERTGLASNTIVVYTADHGDFAGEHGCIEKHDAFLYDCLTHMPLVMQLPDGFEKGRRADCLVEMIDVAPALLELCGFEVPRWMQARSFAPVVRGESSEHKEFVVSQGGVEKEALDRLASADPSSHLAKHSRQYNTKCKVVVDHPDMMMRAKMVRTKDHKYIYRLNGHHEFYDLRNDPAEIRNEIANPAHRASIDDLRERLIRWMVESETNLPLIDQPWP